MADNRKYYYLKLKENFFDSDSIVLLEDMKSEMKDINTKIDRLEYKMTDGFETLELLTENNTNELNKVKIKVSKLEKRVAEFNTVN